MKEVVLEPIGHSNALHKGIAKEIARYFLEAIFKPLFDLLEANNIRTNAVASPVAVALQDRRIWYTDEVFSGKFSAAVSRELRSYGATFDSRTKTFRLPLSQMPLALRQAVAQAGEATRQLNKQVVELLDQIQENAKQASTGLKFDLNGVFVDLRSQYKRSLELRGLAVPPDLTEDVKDAISVEYTNNLDKYIKTFTDKMIPELRSEIQDNIFAGGRPDKLAKIIQAKYGVTKRKAEFLAEQETSLLVSKYRESRYKAVGSRRYVWSTSQDGRVRHDHKDLNGKMFSWENPPISNKATGARNHPGEDFGCRCVARPILPIQED